MSACAPPTPLSLCLAASLPRCHTEGEIHAMEQSYAIHVGGTIASLDNSPSGDYVVVASREVFKVIDVRDLSALREHTNLRGPTRNPQIFYIADAAWNPRDEARVATSTTTGQVAVWDVVKPAGVYTALTPPTPTHAQATNG